MTRPVRAPMRALVPALAFALAFALAGCVAPGLSNKTSAGVAAGAFKLPVALSKDLPGAEPVIATLPDGTLFAQGVGSTSAGTGAVNEIYESTDDGATWKVVTPNGPGELRSNDGFVAVGNGGSVYASNVFS